LLRFARATEYRDRKPLQIRDKAEVQRMRVREVKDDTSVNTRSAISPPPARGSCG